MLYRYLYQLLITSIVIIAYYKYGKTMLIYYAPKVTRFLLLTKYFPNSDIEGTVELAMIATTHVFFCIFLMLILPISYPAFQISWGSVPAYFLYGTLLGIGCMGVSSLLCKIAVQTFELINKNNAYDFKTWLTMGRGGWIRHHLQSIEILPIYLSLFVLAMQVGSEEIIFRKILLNYFMPFGACAAFFTSLIFFVLMQCFLMNRWQGAIFPMIGAAVMGVVHSILYLKVPIVWPLIVAHITFFLFSVI